jgi:hypothetical protein
MYQKNSDLLIQHLKFIFGILFTALLFSSCDEPSYTYEIDPLSHDTINVTNERGRQGRWIITADCARDLPKLPKDTMAVSDTIDVKKNQGYILVSNPGVVSTGSYVDNQKQGRWTSYGDDGSVTKIEDYKDGILITQ